MLAAALLLLVGTSAVDRERRLQQDGAAVQYVRLLSCIQSFHGPRLCARLRGLTLSRLLIVEQYTAVPTNLAAFDNPDDSEHTFQDLTTELQVRLAQLHPGCSRLLPQLTPAQIWHAIYRPTSTEHFCLQTAEQVCAELALDTLPDQGAPAINGVMFDRWDTHCWALGGLRGIHTGNRTQVGGSTHERLLVDNPSPVIRAVIEDSRLRTAQFTQMGTHCVAGWHGTCHACYTDLTFVIEQQPLSGGEACPWPAGLTKPWLCAHDCNGHWTEAEQLTCQPGATGRYPASRKTYVLTNEACCTESFCGKAVGKSFLPEDPIAYDVEAMMGSSGVSSESCAESEEAFFRGMCGTRSSDWVVAQGGQPDDAVNCPLDGAVVESGCMLCPESIPVPCKTCANNDNPDDDIVLSDGSGCEQHLPFPAVSLPGPGSRSSTGEYAPSNLLSSRTLA